MPKLSDRLDEITRKFWQSWKTWRIGQNWTLGSDYPNQKLSPFLVANFDQLPDGGEWFRQHAALMLWTLDDLPLEAWGVVPAPTRVDESAMPRLRSEVERLRTEVEDLRKLVKLRELERDEAFAERDKLKVYTAPEPKPLRGAAKDLVMLDDAQDFSEPEPAAPTPEPPKPKKKKKGWA